MIVPGTGDVQASFAPVAKHYGAVVVACPPRRGNRKGAVECGVKFCCGRWWRTMTATTPEEAQVSLDRFWEVTGDVRLRPPGRYAEAGSLAAGGRPVWPSVGELAGAEVLMALPAAAYPATVEVAAVVDDRATVAFRGNRYSVPPGLGGVEMTLRHRLGTATVEIVSPAPAVVASHRPAPPGAGQVVRDQAHAKALEAVVLAQFSTSRPCDRKANKPPGAAARAERDRLAGPGGVTGPGAASPSVDLDRLAEIVHLAFPGATEVTGAEVGS